jgi:hypothetical protein
MYPTKCCGSIGMTSRGFSEVVLPKEIQIFARSKEIGQKEDLNTFREMNLKGNWRTQWGFNGGSLGE